MSEDGPSKQRYSDKEIVEQAFDEAKFFLGEMEQADLVESRNIHNIRPDDFKYYFRAFLGSLSVIDDFIFRGEEYTGFDEWIEEGPERQMYELFIDDGGIRQEVIHPIQLVKREETSREDIVTMRTIIYGDDGYFFRGEVRGGRVKSELLEEYKEGCNGRGCISVTYLADKFVHDVVHPCLKKQGLIRTGGGTTNSGEVVNY